MRAGQADIYDAANKEELKTLITDQALLQQGTGPARK
jgi:hypothetical protein